MIPIIGVVLFEKERGGRAGQSAVSANDRAAGIEFANHLFFGVQEIGCRDDPVFVNFFPEPSSKRIIQVVGCDAPGGIFGMDHAVGGKAVCQACCSQRVSGRPAAGATSVCTVRTGERNA